MFPYPRHLVPLSSSILCRVGNRGRLVTDLTGQIVSRSTFLFLFFPSPLFGLLKRNCVGESSKNIFKRIKPSPPTFRYRGCREIRVYALSVNWLSFLLFFFLSLFLILSLYTANNIVKSWRHDYAV